MGGGLVVRLDRRALLRRAAVPVALLAAVVGTALALAVFVAVAPLRWDGARPLWPGVALLLVEVLGVVVLARSWWRGRTRFAEPLVLDRAGVTLAVRSLRQPLFLPWESVDSVHARRVFGGHVLGFRLRPGAAEHPGVRGFDRRAARQAATRDGLCLDTRCLTADPPAIARAIADLTGGRICSPIVATSTSPPPGGTSTSP